MKIINGLFLLASIFSVLVICGCGKSELEKAKEKISSLESTISTLNGEIQGLESNIDGLNSKNKSLEDTISRLTKENQLLIKKANDFESDSKRMQEHVSELNTHSSNQDLKLKEYDKERIDNSKIESASYRPNFITFSVVLGIILINNALWVIFYRRK